MNSYIDVVAAIIWQGERFLAAKRPEGKSHAGKWEFPGGKVENGESLEHALIRELDEELGLTPEAFSFWRSVEHEYEHLNVRLHFFHVHSFLGGPEPLEGHTLRWTTPAQAEELPFLAADQKVVRDLKTQTPSPVETN